MKTFFRDLLGMLVMAVCLLSAVQAQGVPGAIKYQAVLRDVNGKTLVNKNDVNIRISLRLDEPVSGTIAYSEVHEGVSTNAYGVIHLEIGRGEVTSGTTLNAIAWGEHKVYVQIEIETDGTGYTHMGNSELLTVPYAFYAENASGKNLYEHLKDNFIPKYNEANKTLVNSGLSQKDRALEVDASSITFVDRSTGKSGYTFPMEAGKKGQVLRLADNMGTLKWDTAGGGGGSASFSFDALDDGKMVYWNNNEGDLKTAPFSYAYNGTKDFTLTGNLKLDGTVSGTNNILTSNALGNGQIWIGDNNAVTSGALTPRNLSGHILMDKEGRTTLNLAMKGIKLIPGTDKDTLFSESDSLWARNAAGNIYAYNQGKDLDKTFVGIGTNDPDAMFHVEGGEVRFSGAKNTDNNIPIFSWNPVKSSLFAGAVGNMNTLINQGNYSLSLGLDALAVSDYGLALGKEANVQGVEAVAIGVQSSAQANQSIALGRSAKVVGGTSGVAIGYLTEVQSSNAVVLGGNSTAKSNSVVIGYNNGMDPSEIEESIVIGKNNGTAINGSIVLGSNNLNAENSILIGRNIPQEKDAIILGTTDFDNQQMGPAKTLVGYSFFEGYVNNLVAMGNGNQYGNQNDSYKPDVNMFGSNLVIENPAANITMLGDNYNYNDLIKIAPQNEYPVFAYGTSAIEDALGQDNGVAFTISDWGNAYFVGEVNANGSLLTSDMRLKTDIKPMFFAPAFLDSLQPVSFVFKSDKKRQTRFGFIAQEVREVFPELVRENAKGMLSMDYIGLVPVLWQINQQLSQKVNALEEQVVEQSRKQLELENELEAIKAKLGM